ncbi:MAG TPA: hypothetical protein VGH28_04460 [Polyangiaceae bacterium]|jgi:hypothetical protein
MRFRSLTVGLAFSLASAVASAQTIDTPPGGAAQGGDTVVLKDGSTLHGTIGEMTPGQALTIKMSDGNSRVVQWPEIQTVNIDRAKPSAPPAEARATTTAVHLEGATDDMVVERLDARGTESHWTTMCHGACDAALPTAGIYRIDGAGLRTSKSFTLAEDRASYRVGRGTGLGFAGGLTMVILGGITVANGVGFIVLGAAWQGVFSNANDYLIGGIVATGIGLALFITGAIVLKGNLRTTVVPLDGTAPPRPVPAWREAPPTLGFGPPMIGTPIFGGTF